ncbi:MAG: thermonuclease family protein [Planctomycetes bacterium]|nr:thermonuclease family protein [Planctomycetota bacterium]
MLTRSLVLALALFAPSAPLLHAQVAAPPPPAAAHHGWKATPPKELFEIERVVDGDTLHIRRNGEVQKLRLLSVDTEEKFSTSTGDASKPSTAFGEECAQWAAQFFKDLAKEGEPSKIGLAFPGEREERDVYGRVLCYVVLPDGRNFNLLLVELGKSPYFNKYGNDLWLHDEFVAAQRTAREKQLGIWNPAANQPKSAGAPAARRPYDELLPWWDARALAVDGYRAALAKHPEHVAAADSPIELARALASSEGGGEVEVFGSIEKFFEEDDGSLTVLFRSSSKDGAFRAKLAKDVRSKFDALDLKGSTEEFRQNYLWVRGKLVKGGRGFDMQCSEPERWRLAGPQPVAPAKR